MDKKLLINLQRVPKHVAIIMDGNGRWARGKGMSRVFGHRNALTAVRESIESAAQIGVESHNFICFFYRKLEQTKIRSRCTYEFACKLIKKRITYFSEKMELL